MLNSKRVMEKEQEDEDLEVEITKIEKQKPKSRMMPGKITAWVSSSFDDFTANAPSIKSNLKTSLSQPISRSSSKSSKTGSCLSQSLLPDSIKNDVSRKRPYKIVESSSMSPKRVLHSNLWVEVYRPNKRADLAVHKKKIEEIYDWLCHNLQRKIKHKAPILVLCGPPGAGKTACVNVLCQEMNVSLQQWENTSQLTSEDFTHSAQREQSKVDVYTSQSQATQFSNFLLRANRYSPLAGICSDDNQTNSPKTTDGKTVIVVEDLPNVFLRDNTQFHSILRKYYHYGQSPLIFIVTESNSSSGSMQKLFPKELQHELHISQINVNPVAATMMMKCLNKIISLSSGQKNFYAPSHSVLELIAQGSAGDLRAALNILQFACSKKESVNFNELHETGMKIQRKNSTSSKHKSKNKMALSSDDGQSVIGLKDTSVFLFNAVGKILYFKRGNPIDFPEHSKLPAHLSSHERDPLLVDPEEVVSKVHISSDFFSSFLHENYVTFVDSLEDLERASEYFSHADTIGSIWTGREDLEKYSLSLTTRGFIHSNSAMCRYDSVRKNRGWNPLHKSQWFPTVKQAAQNSLSARLLFRGCHWEPEVLCTELIPYIHLTNPTLHDPEQISFVHQMTQFARKGTSLRARHDLLNEKEAVEEEEKDGDMTYSTSHLLTNQGGELGGESGRANKDLNPGPANPNPTVDEEDWGSDWEADDADILGGSQNKVDLTPTEDVVDFLIEDFDE